MANLYKNSRNCLNQNRAMFEGVGMYDIPVIKRQEIDLNDNLRWISFNHAFQEKKPEECVCHFYLDDYQFERLWRDPDRYIALFKKFKAITSPDFSLFVDYPIALQIYNHFRKQWLGAYYQTCGVKVIPTVCWSDKRSYDFCFDGIIENSIVTVSDVGCRDSKKATEYFDSGFDEMIKRIYPKKIFLYTSKTDYSLDDIGCEVKIIKNKQIERFDNIRSEKLWEVEAVQVD